MMANHRAVSFIGYLGGELRIAHSSSEIPFLLALNIRTGLVSAWVVEPRKRNAAREGGLSQTPRHARVWPPGHLI